jgi:hypothetical protein
VCGLEHHFNDAFHVTVCRFERADIYFEAPTAQPRSLV